MVKNQQIRNYLINNPVDRGKPDCYKTAADKFGVSKDRIRGIYRRLRYAGEVEPDGPAISDQFEKTNLRRAEREFEEDIKFGKGQVTVNTTKKVSTLQELIKVCQIDLKEWNIDRWICNQWQVGAKNSANKIEVTPLFQVKAWLSRRKVETDLVKQKEALLKELKAYAPIVGPLPKKLVPVNGGSLLEICIFDPHFGKLAWREETDDDFDLKIIENRVKQAVKNLLGRVNLDQIKKILLPIGNDLINIDNRHNTTFAGTPQDSDCRYMKIIKTVKRVLIEIIDDLSRIAPVDVIIVPGNHDTTSSFMIGEILESFFFNNKRVNIDNVPKMRKYYQFGLNSFQFTHGNEEKHDSLGLIFATEQPNLWANTKFRFCQLGHFHKNKKINYVSVDEHQGFQVQIMPSLSGTDFWHKSKGYNTLKQAKALLFDPNEGLIGEFTTTLS